MNSALRAHAQVWLWRGFSKKWAVLASEVQISDIWNFKCLRLRSNPAKKHPCKEVRVAWNPLGCIKKWEADSH